MLFQWVTSDTWHHFCLKVFQSFSSFLWQPCNEETGTKPLVRWKHEEVRLGKPIRIVTCLLHSQYDGDLFFGSSVPKGGFKCVHDLRRTLAKLRVSNHPSCSFKPSLARSLGNLYSLDDFVDEGDMSTPSYPSPPPASFSPSSLLPSGPPPPRFGFGYPIPSFQQEVNSNLSNPPAHALRPVMRGAFRPNPRVPVPGALASRHLSRSIPVSRFSDFFFFGQIRFSLTFFSSSLTLKPEILLCHLFFLCVLHTLQLLQNKHYHLPSVYPEFFVCLSSNLKHNFFFYFYKMFEHGNNRFALLQICTADFLFLSEALLPVEPFLNTPVFLLSPRYCFRCASWLFLPVCSFNSNVLLD